MRRKFIFIILLMITSSSLLFSKDTQLQFYRPFTETIKHNVVKPTVKKYGECLGPSMRVSRADAWRCTAEYKTYDPCFLKPFGKNKDMVCLDSPWTTEAIQIELEKSVVESSGAILDMSRNLPWALELATGIKCQANDSKEMYDNLPIHYHCDDHSFLIGHIQRCASNWKVLQKDKNGVITAEIDHAWF